MTRSSQEVVARIIALHRAGNTISAIAREVGLSRTTVRYWLGEKSANRQRRRCLSDAEVVVLKELAVLLRWPPKDVIAALRKVVPFRHGRPLNKVTYWRALSGVQLVGEGLTKKPEKWQPGTIAVSIILVIWSRRDGSPAGHSELLLLGERSTGWIRARFLSPEEPDGWMVSAKRFAAAFSKITSIPEGTEQGFFVSEIGPEPGTNRGRRSVTTIRGMTLEEATRDLEGVARYHLDEPPLRDDVNALRLPASFMSRKKRLLRFLHNKLNAYNLGSTGLAINACPMARLAALKGEALTQGERDAVRARTSGPDLEDGTIPVVPTG